MITCIKYPISFVIMLFALSGYPLYIIAAWPLVLLLFSLCCSKTNKEGQLEDYLLNEAYVLYIILNVQQHPSIIFRKNNFFTLFLYELKDFSFFFLMWYMDAIAIYYIPVTVHALRERDPHTNATFGRELFGIVIVESGNGISYILQAITSCLFIWFPRRRGF